MFHQILPKKEEHVVMIRLSPVQKTLYQKLMELTRNAYNDSLNPVKTFSLCCKVSINVLKNRVSVNFVNPYLFPSSRFPEYLIQRINKENEPYLKVIKNQ